jgi:hypothetical protein
MLNEFGICAYTHIIRAVCLVRGDKIWVQDCWHWHDRFQVDF